MTAWLVAVISVKDKPPETQARKKGERICLLAYIMERDIRGDEMERTECEILRDIRMDDRSIREDSVCQTDPTTYVKK